MLNCYTIQSHSPISLEVVNKADFAAWYAKQNASTQRWVTSCGFEALPGKSCLLPDINGSIVSVACGYDNNPWQLASIINQLPAGVYQFRGLEGRDLYFAQLAWGLHQYQFRRYLANKSANPVKQLVLDDDAATIDATVSSIYLVRDLINTPCEDMGPEQLADAALLLASEFGATCEQLIGDQLLAHNYPMIHAVGRASAQAPRLIDFRWGDNDAPLVTLIGKGVCFDSGGLNLKPSSGIRLMKKDMGGAAHVLGLAKLIMQLELPIQLRVLIPAVENAVSGNAYRPGDVLTARNGMTVEIGDTDAEGRLVLADAIAAAVEEGPDLIIDFATLTGAARVAMGSDVPALFSNVQDLASDLMALSQSAQDLVWQLPLHAPYRDGMLSSIADLSNVSKSPYGGAITAALFLNEFVGTTPWVHFDVMAWNMSSQPGRPEGGEAMGLRAVTEFLVKRYVKR